MPRASSTPALGLLPPQLLSDIEEAGCRGGECGLSGVGEDSSQPSTRCWRGRRASAGPPLSPKAAGRRPWRGRRCVAAVAAGLAPRSFSTINQPSEAPLAVVFELDRVRLLFET